MSHSTTWAGDLTPLNARVIDGKEHEPFVASIVVRDGEIAEISTFIKNATGEVIDLTGFTILPGLIDSHVHLQSVPGSKYRNDSIEVIEELRKHHLKAYVASGVTTVLDTAISASVLRDIQNHLKQGGTGLRVLALAPVLFSAGGYLDGDLFKSSSKPATNESDVLDLFEEFKDMPGIVGIKVPLEYGFGPIHSPEMRKTIARIAIEKERPL
jgi:dihydroorotase-like cyclic amidohydrolase